MLSLNQIRNILTDLCFPQKNITDTTCVSILALSDTKPRANLIKGKNCLADGARITDILEFARTDLNINYAENTRETIRKHSVKYLVDFGLALVNADNPNRPTNSGLTNYTLVPGFRLLLDLYTTNPSLYEQQKNTFINHDLLARREQLNIIKDTNFINITVPQTQQILSLSPGDHNLIQAVIIHELFPTFYLKPLLIYVGDTKNKDLFFDENLTSYINLTIDTHQKLPDVIGFDVASKKVIIFEAVASSGPVDILRKKELENIFALCPYPIDFYSVFLTPSMYQKFAATLAPGSHGIVLETKSIYSVSTY